MSDMSQGPGWWQASDGKWYPPEQAPGGQPATGGQPAYGAGPTYGAPGAATAYGAPGAPGTGGQGALAEWPQRVVASLIDSILLLPVWIVVYILGQASTALGLLGNLVLLAASLYFAYLNGATGQSPGKALTGLKVVNEKNGQLIGGGAGVIRNFAHIADLIVCGLGFLLPLFDSKKQTIADKIMSTVVLSGAEKRAFGPEIFKA